MPEPRTQYAEQSIKATKQKIASLMIFAGIFSVVGAELRATQTPKTGVGGLFTSPPKILLGTAIGGTLLLVMADLGGPAEEFAFGLSLITFTAAVLIEAGPVWKWLAGLVGATGSGGKPTTATGVTTATGATP